MESNLSKEEGFEIIRKMIESAKEKVRKRDAFFLLYWGYIIVISSLVSFTGHVTEQYYLTYIWFLPIVAVPFSVYKGIQMSKTNYVKTYVSDVISGLWTSFGISLLLFVGVVMVFAKEYVYLICPVSLLLVAVGIFTTGRAFRFKPLIWGALICWAGAIACFYYMNYWQYLIYPVAMFFGYILPGHILRSKANV